VSVGNTISSPPAHDAVASGEVPTDGELLELCSLGRPGHLGRRAFLDLHSHESSGSEGHERRREEPLVQIDPAEDRQHRFRSHVRRQRAASVERHVRRIAHDHVERAVEIAW
jgi:hypothetical protein